MNLMSVIQEHDSELLISFHQGKITIFKNRYGEHNKNIDLIGLFEEIRRLDKYQYYQNLFDSFINRLKIFRPFI